MRLVIPISAADNPKNPEDGSPNGTVRDMVSLQLDVLAHYGGLEQHQIFIVPTPSQEAIGKEMADALEGLCPNVSCGVLRDQGIGVLSHYEPQDPWPVSANNHFARAAYMVAELKEAMPWLWYELDTFPTQEGWMDRLAVAYQNGGNDYMGCVIRTEHADPAGNRRQLPNDTVMLGVAVYPHHMGLMRSHARLSIGMAKVDMATVEINRQMAIYKDLEALAIPGDPAQMEQGMATSRAQCVAEAFDWYLRQSIIGAGRTDTNLITDQWNTFHYRMVNSDLVCDPGPRRGLGRDRGGVVSPLACLVHGCKDGTGHKLAAQGLIPKMAWTPQTPQARLAKAIAGPKTQEPSELTAVTALLLQSQKESEERLMRALAAFGLNGATHPRQTEAEPEPANPAREQFERDEAASLERMRSQIEVPRMPETPKAKIYEFMKGKRVTLKKLSDHLGQDEAAVKALVESCPDLSLSGPPINWVSQKTEVAA